ncbi:MAG: hypothetical protein DRH07_00960 [Deltaproteobacteria bacterium]|nr:MAG: hypothetical protein DRH07_00960 [Deltaproteobacteria bacterium]
MMTWMLSYLTRKIVYSIHNKDDKKARVLNVTFKLSLLNQMVITIPLCVIKKHHNKNLDKKELFR